MHSLRRRLRRHPRLHRTDPLRAAALLLVLGALLDGCRASEPPVLGAVPAFELTERSGTAVRSQDLAGSVWIAGFIFTRCPDVCPALTSHMADLQRSLDGSDPVRLVSFSVDPAHDTPDVLRGYADRAGARPGWLFVTGPRDQIATLLKDGFHLAFADDGPPASPITHSDRLVLVDRELQIRGYYRGRDAAELARLTRDAAALNRTSRR